MCDTIEMQTLITSLKRLIFSLQMLKVHKLFQLNGHATNHHKDRMYFFKGRLINKHIAHMYVCTCVGVFNCL